MEGATAYGKKQKCDKILLQTFLGKQIRNVTIIPQNTILGVDTDKHGIRLDAYIEELSDEIDPNLTDAELISDVYDIEPNKTIDKETLPKRTRYYHSLVDTQFLAPGADYSKLPNVVIIMILPYEDGATKIYLYTNGNANNTSQPLKDMLKYIQNSTDDNVTNQDIATIQKLAKKVKHKKEVGINYMKSWEYEKWLSDSGQGLS